MPGKVVDVPVGVEQVLFEDVPARFPRDPEVAPGQEARRQVSCKVVHPPFSPELVHHCVHGWEPNLPILPPVKLFIKNKSVL